jgi:hypothetical protein
LIQLELHKNRNPVPSEEVVDLSENLNDDRNFISIDDKTILIIEDASFAEVLLQVARDNGFKAVAYQGETGYKYAKKIQAESDYFRYEITGN